MGDLQITDVWFDLISMACTLDIGMFLNNPSDCNMLQSLRITASLSLASFSQNDEQVSQLSETQWWALYCLCRQIA